MRKPAYDTTANSYLSANVPSAPNHRHAQNLSTAPSDYFFQFLNERRLYWPRRPMLSDQQQSSLEHLQDQFAQSPLPSHSPFQLTALVNHPDFPAESIGKLLSLFNLC